MSQSPIPNPQSPIPYPLYPYLLNAVVKAKIWGGRNLEGVLGKKLPDQDLIGETWEAWEGCTIANGEHQGKTLASLIERDAAGILGSAAADARFPLLFKFIDAQDDLSVQVHPDDAEAQAMERQPFGKTEAWYVLHAEPGAKLILGFNQEVTPERVAASIKDKTLVDLLAFVPVERGDVLFVPAGTVHAIGKGIVLAEIQENSDITYRLYDWGREAKGRELHIAQSLDVLGYGRMTGPKIPAAVIPGRQFDRHYLVACRYFALELLHIHSPRPEFRLNGGFHILSAIKGGARLVFGKDFKQDLVVTQGQTVLIPAGLEMYALAPMGALTELLRAYVPDLRRDVVEPLKAAGNDEAAIARLGGSVPQHNDLSPLVPSPAG